MSRASSGKWSIGKGSNGITYLYAESHAQPIARPLRGMGKSQLSDDEFLANAALLADAKKLLRQVKAMVELAEGKSAYSQETVLRKARELIARHE